MKDKYHLLEAEIRAIKKELMALGDLRPGSLSSLEKFAYIPALDPKG